MYIVVEGPDCSGKDTLIEKLCETLKEEGITDFLVVREPSDHDDYCRNIRHKLETDKTLTDMHRYRLLMDLRGYLYRKVVGPALEKGTIVISNRNFLSTLAYQRDVDPGMVINDVRDLSYDYGCYPSVIALLTIEHEIFLSRLGARAGETTVLESRMYEKKNFDSVMDTYLDVIYDTRLLKKVGCGLLPKTIIHPNHTVEDSKHIINTLLDVIKQR